MANTLLVQYFGTNVGKIYFTDVDKRNQLGGAQEGNYNGGQDQYIMWGETKFFSSQMMFYTAWQKVS
jgi:hypothetical protein